MKNSGLLIAFALIGYGFYKFTQSGSKSAFGSPLKSSGTAKIPSVLGAAKPGGAPVTNGGFSTPPIGSTPSRSPAGGESSIDLGALSSAAQAAAKALAEAAKRWFSGSDAPPDFTDTIDWSASEDIFDFNEDLNWDAPLNSGFDDVDTSIYEGQA